LSALVDSHCHLNFEPMDQQLDQVLQRAKENHVDFMLCVSVNLEHYPEVLAIAEQHSNIFASVGVHPNEQSGADPDSGQLVKLAQHERVVAIGETGLDYFRSTGDMTWQHNRFRNHIQAAKSVNKPLIIHTRDAAEDTMRILEEEGAEQCGGVMHCFVENWDIAKRALDLGFYISLSGIVTFKNAKDLQDVAKQLPLDRILVETDSPYLAPVPYRGKSNEPAYVLHVARFLAELRGENYEQIAEQTTNNFFNLFKQASQLRAA
jgi:TatD DNase family protein